MFGLDADTLRNIKKVFATLSLSIWVKIEISKV
jgi:hypothetical protein